MGIGSIPVAKFLKNPPMPESEVPAPTYAECHHYVTLSLSNRHAAQRSVLFPAFLDLKKNLLSQAAETLAEVIIALVVLAVGATGAATLVYASISANAENKQYIQAYNFAREGVEAMRNIRDTNWLRFPGNREECWDVTLETTDPTACTEALGAEKIGSSTGVEYVIYPQLDEESGAAIDLFAWKLFATSTGTDTTIYEYTFESNATLYVNDPEGVLGALPATPYSRAVTVVRTTDAEGNEIMIVSSTVTWQFKNRTKTVTFTDELTNF